MLSQFFKYFHFKVRFILFFMSLESIKSLVYFTKFNNYYIYIYSETKLVYYRLIYMLGFKELSKLSKKRKSNEIKY
jgi:hypothetical protein